MVLYGLTWCGFPTLALAASMPRGFLLRRLRSFVTFALLFCIARRAHLNCEHDRFAFALNLVRGADALVNRRREHGSRVVRYADVSSRRKSTPFLQSPHTESVRSKHVSSRRKERSESVAIVKHRPFPQLVELLDKYNKMDPYAVLGVPFLASRTSVREHYIELCKTDHPDLHGGTASMRWLLGNWGYDTLSDPKRRSAYEFSRLGRTAGDIAEGLFKWGFAMMSEMVTNAQDTAKVLEQIFASEKIIEEESKSKTHAEVSQWIGDEDSSRAAKRAAKQAAKRAAKRAQSLSTSRSSRAVGKAVQYERQPLAK